MPAASAAREDPLEILDSEVEGRAAHSTPEEEGRTSGRSSSRIGLVLLVAGLAVQLCLTAMLFIEPPVLDIPRLSQWGAFALHPEREAPLYLACVAGALLLIALLTVFSDRTAPAGSAGRAGPVLASQTAQGSVAIVATVLFLGILVMLRPYGVVQEPFPRGLVAALGLLILLTTVFLAAALRVRPRAGSARAPSVATEPFQTTLTPLKFSPWDLIVPIGIVALLYVPEWTLASGRVFLEENNIHWDLFAMGPALMFRHGEALGTQVHSYYGAGWPVVFAGLSRWLPISYGRMVQIGSIYLCVYLCGIYLLFRVLLRAPLRAVAGTVLVLLPFFWWMYGLYLWRAPNVTPLRWPFDVWCLLALVLHARSSKRIWAATAGLCAGLAIFFNINGGLELTAAAAFYFIAVVLLSREPRSLQDFAYAGLTTAVVAAAGLAFAGRGKVMNLEFWAGWLSEPLVFSSLPLLTGVSGPTLFWFGTLVFFYLSVAGWAVTRSVGVRANRLEWLTGAIAVYGLMMLIKFVRYSSDQTFYRLLTPAAILVMVLATRTRFRVLSRSEEAGGRKPERSIRLRTLAFAGGALAVVLALLGPQSLVVGPVLDYPNLIALKVRGTTPEGICLMRDPKDLCGLPPQFEQTATRFQAIAGRLRDLKTQGRTFAVIDENGSLFHAATDTAPFGRYPRIFFTAITRQRVGEITDFLRSNPPDYVLTRLPLAAGSPDFETWSTFGIGPRDDSFYGDMWQSLHQVVSENYRLEETMTPYQLWRLDEPAGQAGSGSASRR